MTTIKTLLTTILALTTAIAATAQGEKVITNARMISIGGSQLLDTYLSPEKYRGGELRYISHTQRGRDSVRLYREIIHQGSFSYLDNRSGNGGEMAGVYNFQYGWHWRMLDIVFPKSQFTLAVGANFDANIGFIYNTRNSNNPAQAIAAFNATPVVEACYRFSIRSYPLAVRYHVGAPLMGLMFSPNYAQSYYEIFSEGNYDHNVVPTWVGNAPSMRQMLTVDFNILRSTVRLGYLGDYQQASVNHLKRHIYTHAFVIGIVRKFSLKKIQQP